MINDGGSGFGYFVGVGLLTDQWVWWLIGGVDLWFGQWGGGGLIVLVSGGGIWVWFAENLVLIVLEFGEEHKEFEEPVVKWRTSWRTLRNVF